MAAKTGPRRRLTMLIFFAIRMLVVSGQDTASCTNRDLPVVRRLEDIPVDSYGRPGLRHMTIAGAVHHGMKEVEVWIQTFAPGSGTPIHRHDCEEVFLVLQGAGTVYIAGGLSTDLNATPGFPVESRISKNTTFSITPNVVHRVWNTEQEGDLQLLVIISRPPIKIFRYNTWQTPHSAAQKLFPYPWDAVCPDEIGVAKRTLARAGERVERREDL